MLYTAVRKDMITLNNGLYRTGQFAKRASVSLRTLRFYDQLGLLSPSGYTESGYRLYTDEDLSKLQQILALKYLGLSLDEVQECLNRMPERLKDTLGRQKLLMTAKRRHLDGVIRAIDAAEENLNNESFEWNDLTRVIEAMQMEQNKEWVKNYFTDEQVKTLGELVGGSYSDEARAKFTSGQVWTEEDQKKASADWQYVADESNRLATVGADPSGEEGQALAKFKSDLLSAFTKNDPQVEVGLKQFWKNHNALPKDQQPLASWSDQFASPGGKFLEKAMAIYQERVSE
jgi:DNA-binding transcriptional MerR regulator